MSLDSTFQEYIISYFGAPEPQGPITYSLLYCCIYTLDDFLTLDTTQLKSIHYHDTDNNVINLSLSEGQRLADLCIYADQHIMTRDHWLNITPKAARCSLAPPPTPVQAAHTTALQPDLVVEFMKGIKKKIADYQTFENDNQWKCFKNCSIT